MESTDTVKFCKMESLQHQDQLVEMMRSLYEEDETLHPVNHSLFPTTVERLVLNPSTGQIVLFLEDAYLRGYALLIPYWSNEFGGVLLFVDELFVSCAYRNQGLGRRFFLYLEQQRPFDAVALALEVSPNNRDAQRLYESIGFVQRRNATLTRTLYFRQSVSWRMNCIHRCERGTTDALGSAHQPVLFGWESAPDDF